MPQLLKCLKKEVGLILTLALLLFFKTIGSEITPETSSILASSCITFTLFAVMMIASFAIVKHADWLAEHFGEPYGTLILTLSVISIEVALIVTLMLASHNEPTLARDTMFAVIMIAVCGFAGLSLIIGGIKHRTQMYNIKGASAYLAILVPLITVCLILPNYTIATTTATFSKSQAVIMIMLSIMLYVVFLIKQTITHQEYFMFSPHNREEDSAHDYGSQKQVLYHITMLVFGLFIMIMLSKIFAAFLDYNIQSADLPSKLGGIIVALLVLTPEGVSAAQASYRNELQRSINLCMGSAVATICLTIPAVLSINLFLDQTVILGLSPTGVVLAGLTFLVSMITFMGQRTSVLNGAVLFSIFIVYLALVFDLPN